MAYAATRLVYDLINNTQQAWIRELAGTGALPDVFSLAQRAANQRLRIDAIRHSFVPKLTPIPQPVWNAASGVIANLNSPGLKSSKNVHKFIYGLFDLVAADGHALNDQDLFHAHMVDVDVGGAATGKPQLRDVALVFHAKEYPTDLFPRAGIRDVRGNLSPTFDSRHPRFADRNYIWLLSQNRLWCISGNPAVHSDFKELLFPADEAPDRTNFLYDDRIAGRAFKQDLLGQEFAVANYFPNHLAGNHRHRKVFFK